MEIHRQYLLVRPRAEVPGVRICRATRLVYNKDGIQKMRRGHLFKWEESKHPHWKVTHMCSKCERRNARFPNDSKEGKMRIRIPISNFLKTHEHIVSQPDELDAEDVPNMETVANSPPFGTLLYLM